IAGEMSIAVTRAPRRAIARASLPSPHPTSMTRFALWGTRASRDFSTGVNASLGAADISAVAIRSKSSATSGSAFIPLLPVRRFVILEKFSPNVLAGVESADDGIHDQGSAVHNV